MVFSSPVLTTGSDSSLHTSYSYDSNSETGGLNGYFTLQTKCSFLPLFSQRKKPGPHLTLSGVTGGSSSRQGADAVWDSLDQGFLQFHSKTRMTSVCFLLVFLPSCWCCSCSLLLSICSSTSSGGREGAPS